MKLAVAFVADDADEARRRCEEWIRSEPRVEAGRVDSVENLRGSLWTIHIEIAWAA